MTTFVQRTNLADLRMGDRVFVPGYTAPKVIVGMEVERSRITVKVGKDRRTAVIGSTFDRVVNTLADAIR